MRIALCKSFFAGPVSGADETIVSYATRLHEAGHAVTVVLLQTPAPDDQYYKRLRRAGVEVACVVEQSALYLGLRAARDLFLSLFFFAYIVPGALERLRRAWQAMYRLAARLYARRCRAFLARLRPDLLHVFTPDAGAALLIRAGHELGIPVLYHELGTPHYRPALDVYYRELAKVLPLCDEFAALSPRLAEQWAEKFPFLKSVSVLPLIVDDRDSRAAAWRRPGAGATVFGYAARVEEGKGPLVLVEALAELNRAGQAGLVRVAGTGPQLPEARACVRELGLDEVCEFVGFYTEPLGRSVFMQSLDVFVLPSLAEGTPNSLIEAMAHGLPVIASDVGGIADLVTPDAGLLVPPGDAAALCDAMRRLASDPSLRASMGRAARGRYLKLFTPDAVLPVLRGAYLRVAAARASRNGGGDAPSRAALLARWD